MFSSSNLAKVGFHFTEGIKSIDSIFSQFKISLTHYMNM